MTPSQFTTTDWEYPILTQWNDYSNLVIELSDALHAIGKKTSSAQTFNVGLSNAALSKLDIVNIMAYDMPDRNGGSGSLGNGGQHSTFKKSADEISKLFIDKGVTNSHIVLGLPWYSCALNDVSNQKGWSAIYDLLKDSSLDIDPGVNTILNSNGSGISFNGINLIRDKLVYSAKCKLGGTFCWQMTCDFLTPKTEVKTEYSMKTVTMKTIADYINK